MGNKAKITRICPYDMCMLDYQFVGIPLGIRLIYTLLCAGSIFASNISSGFSYVGFFMFGLPFTIEYYSHIKFIWPMRRWSWHFVPLILSRGVEVIGSGTITFIGIFGLFGAINMSDGVLNVIPGGIKNDTIINVACVAMVLFSLFDLMYEPSPKEKQAYNFLSDKKKAA